MTKFKIQISYYDKIIIICNISTNYICYFLGFSGKICFSECRDRKLRQIRLFAQKLSNQVHAQSCATRPSHWCYANDNKLARVGHVLNLPIPITFITNSIGIVTIIQHDMSLFGLACIDRVNGIAFVMYTTH